MRKQLRFREALLLLLAFLAFGIKNIEAQNITTPMPVPVPFGEVTNSALTMHGELKVIANAIVGPDQTLQDENGVNRVFTPNDDYNGPETNNRKVFGYIDIDNDPATFSSSNADLASSNPGCGTVVYAGLYWAASYYVDRTSSDGTAGSGDFVRYENLLQPDNRPDYRTLKFKPAWSTSYIDILPSRTQVLYDGYRNTPTNPNDIAVKDIPYACYADVTDIFTAMPDDGSIDGTYTIANMRASIGQAATNSSGISGGWVLVVAYEDASLSKKYISTNNGYVVVNSDNSGDITYTNFQTPPPPLQVNARYSIASLEGDFDLAGDRIRITTPQGTLENLFTVPANPANNFFDSSISVDGVYVDRPARVPASRNTLGFDADIFDIPNFNNSLIGNNQSSVDFTLTSSADEFSVFFNSFQVELIEPELVVEKRVLDSNEVDITGGDVNFADELFYEITIQNKGNEDIINTSIRDRIPANVNFSGAASVQADPGMNWTYNAATREFDITIDDNIIERFDGPSKIRYRVAVAASCADLQDACSNEIGNSAFANYTGKQSFITVGGQESIAEQDACGLNIPGTPNVLIREDICFTEQLEAILCSGQVELVAGAGFSEYSWEGPSGSIAGNTQSIAVTEPGTYTVTKTGSSDCRNGTETFIVTDGETAVNPVIAIATNLGGNPDVNGNIRICPITGNDLPEIFLCGAGTTIDLDSGFVNAAEILWERLDPAACASVPRDENCPTADPACEPEWITVGDGIVYTANQAGEYRITTTFDGGCVQQFYFNVYVTDYDPQIVVVEEIICGNPGTLIVANESSQYEYQLMFPNGNTTPYQASPEFTGLTAAGAYTVNARQNNGLPEACVFQTTQFLDAREANVIINTISPICEGNLGEVQIAVTDGEINYTYTISNGTGNINLTTGPIASSDYVFSALPPDTYIVEVLSFDGKCIQTEQVTLLPAEPLFANAVLVKDLSCNSNYQPDPALPFFDPDQNTALIEVIVNGGLGDFVYSTTPDFSTLLSPEPGETNIFRFIQAGTYTIYVQDVATACIFISSGIVVSPYEALQASATTGGVACAGDTGNIGVTVTAGAAPYVYTLDSTTVSGPTMETTVTFNNIDPSQIHTVTITDTFGCIFTLPEIVFVIPSPITANVTTVQATTLTGGEIRVENTAGGTPPYEYSLDGLTFSSSNVFTDVPAGNYTVSVRDNNGCLIILQVTIDPATDPLVIDLDQSNTNILCFGEATASISSTVTGGSGTYAYTITGTDFLGNPITITTQAESSFGNLMAGSYEYLVTDDNGDIASASFVVTQPLELIVTATTSNVACSGDQNGTITVIADGGTTPYVFSLYTSSGAAISLFVEDSIDGVAGTHTFEDLVAGAYRVEAEDTNGCLAVSTDLIINEPAPITLDLVVTPITNEADGSIVINALGGAPPYIFELKEAATGAIIATQANNIFTVGVAGEYILSAIDSNACTVVQPVEVESTQQNPLLEYADEIFFCAITGQVYPTITVQDTTGETIDLPFAGVAAIVWQKFDEITCDIELQDNCPTTDSSCSSGWFDLCTTLDCDITDPGEYRVVIEFVAKSTDKVQTYYFKIENNNPDIKQNLTMYPNPAEDIVVVNADVKTIQVFDVMGKQVLETTENTYNIVSLRSGIYFAKIITKDDKEKILKLIKE